MLWVVRGTYEHTGEDVSIVIDVKTRAEAEYIARRRGIPVVIVEPATEHDVRIARKAKRLYTWHPRQGYSCFGRPVGSLQLACLMVCGVLTALTILHSAHGHALGF